MASAGETNAKGAKSAPSSIQWRLKASRNVTNSILPRKNKTSIVDDQKSPQSTDEECKTFQDEIATNGKDHHSEEFSLGHESDGTGEEVIRRRSSFDKREAAKHYNMPPRESGVVVKFSPQRGYGFIRPDSAFNAANGAPSLPDVFVHRTSIVSTDKVPNLRVGQSTEYDVTLDQRTGKPHAVNVTVTNTIPRQAPSELKAMARQGERTAIVLGNKCKKRWPSSSTRKMGRINRMTPIKTMPNQSFPPKARLSDAWERSRLFEEDKSAHAWDTDEGKVDFAKDLNMTVTIDNELPDNVACYSYRSNSIPPNWAHYHQNYPHQMNYHNDMSHPQNYANHPNDYPNYSRRDYWYCDQEKHMAQYNSDYRNYNGYDDYRSREGYRPNQQW